MDRQLNVASFFTGAGGFDTGFESAGFNIAVASDIWQDAADTFKKNHPTTEFLLKDIKNIKETELLDVLRKKGVEKIDVVIGGPPCQCFTRLNNNYLHKDDERKELFRDYLRMIRILNPDFVVMENVADLLVRKNNKGKLYVDLITESFKRAGYSVNYHLFRTQYYGVPQKRKRVIFIATRLPHVDISFPQADSIVATVKDHLAKLKNKKNLTNIEVVQNEKFIKTRIKHIPQGGYYEHLPARLKTRKVRNGKLQIVKRYGSYLRRLKSTEPAITITKNYLIHPTKHRYLTNREKATLHTFPASYEFKGAHGSVCQQIANAVPPELAHRIAKHILKLYEQNDASKKQTHTSKTNAKEASQRWQKELTSSKEMMLSK